MMVSVSRATESALYRSSKTRQTNGNQQRRRRRRRQHFHRQPIRQLLRAQLYRPTELHGATKQRLSTLATLLTLYRRLYTTGRHCTFIVCVRRAPLIIKNNNDANSSL